MKQTWGHHKGTQSLGGEKQGFLVTSFEHLDPLLPESRMPKFLGDVLVILLLILKAPGFLFLSGESPDEDTNEYILSSLSQ